jgi:hypothetical protein
MQFFVAGRCGRPGYPSETEALPNVAEPYRRGAKMRSCARRIYDDTQGFLEQV